MLELTGHGQPAQDAPTYKHPGARRALIGLLGPAFVASIAYVDPGNVAANLTAGAQYGYLLVWVLVAANVMAVLVQYQSAKLGIVTGKSLPEILGERLKPFWRRAFWLQGVQGAKLASEAISQQTQSVPLPSLRGSLLDRHGNALAASEDAATIFAVPPEVAKPALAAAARAGRPCRANSQKKIPLPNASGTIV